MPLPTEIDCQLPKHHGQMSSLQLISAETEYIHPKLLSHLSDAAHMAQTTSRHREARTSLCRGVAKPRQR